MVDAGNTVSSAMCRDSLNVAFTSPRSLPTIVGVGLADGDQCTASGACGADGLNIRSGALTVDGPGYVAIELELQVRISVPKDSSEYFTCAHGDIHKLQVRQLRCGGMDPAVSRSSCGGRPFGSSLSQCAREWEEGSHSPASSITSKRLSMREQELCAAARVTALRSLSTAGLGSSLGCPEGTCSDSPSGHYSPVGKVIVELSNKDHSLASSPSGKTRATGRPLVGVHSQVQDTRLDANPGVAGTRSSPLYSPMRGTSTEPDSSGLDVPLELTRLEDSGEGRGVQEGKQGAGSLGYQASTSLHPIYRAPFLSMSDPPFKNIFHRSGNNCYSIVDGWVASTGNGRDPFSHSEEVCDARDNIPATPSQQAHCAVKSKFLSLPRDSCESQGLPREEHFKDRIRSTQYTESSGPNTINGLPVSSHEKTAILESRIAKGVVAKSTDFRVSQNGYGLPRSPVAQNEAFPGSGEVATSNPIVPKESGEVATSIPIVPKESGEVATSIPIVPKESGDVVTSIPIVPKESDEVVTTVPTVLKESDEVVTSVPSVIKESDEVVTNVPDLEKGEGSPNPQKEIEYWIFNVVYDEGVNVLNDYFLINVPCAT